MYRYTSSAVLLSSALSRPPPLTHYLHNYVILKKQYFQFDYNLNFYKCRVKNCINFTLLTL